MHPVVDAHQPGSIKPLIDGALAGLGSLHVNIIDSP